MSYRRLWSYWVACVAVIGFVCLAGSPATVQAQTTPSDGGEVARTAWGDPDLQGIWNNATITPLQRPDSLGDKAFLTAEEVAEMEQRAAERHSQANAPSEVRTEPLPAGGNVGAYNSFWNEQGDGGRTDWSDVADFGSDERPPATTDS